jgi:triacylglycerol lipase
MRLFLWIYVMIVEAICLGFVILFSPLSFFEQFKKHEGKGRPIVLVHGYLHYAAIWFCFRHRLIRSGFGPIYAINLGYPFRSVEQYERQLAEKIDQIVRETGRSDLALIGHSMGGLVGAYAAVKNPDKVAKVVLIGAPLRGSKMAYIAPGKDGREMEADSPFTQRLLTLMEASRGVEFYFVASKADELIVPKSSALWGKNPKNELMVDGIGHLTLIFSKRVAQKILGWLAN